MKSRLYTNLSATLKFIGSPLLFLGVLGLPLSSLQKANRLEAKARACAVSCFANSRIKSAALPVTPRGQKLMFPAIGRSKLASISQARANATV